MVKKNAVLKETGQAEKRLEGSEHVDALKYLTVTNATDESDAEFPTFDSRMYENDSDDEEELPEIALQDLHKMLHVFLSGYKTIEESGGIPWDKLHNSEKLHLQLIPFVIFCRVDGGEANKLCGRYSSKTRNI
jgi:hypothetical protein